MKKQYLNKAIFILFVLAACQRPVKNDAGLFAKCMEKFNDAAGCREMLGQPSADETVLAAEIQSDLNLFIRKDLKNLLQSKSKSFVITKIGIPDEVLDRGGDTYFKYNRPVTRYSSATPPDRDLTVIFRRSRVSQVEHTPPAK